MRLLRKACVECTVPHGGWGPARYAGMRKVVTRLQGWYRLAVGEKKLRTWSARKPTDNAARAGRRASMCDLPTVCHHAVLLQSVPCRHTPPPRCAACRAAALPSGMLLLRKQRPPPAASDATPVQPLAPEQPRQ